MRSAVEPKEDNLLSGEYAELPPREGLAVELAERMAMDPHSITDEFWTSLKTQFSDDELVELTFASAIFNWGNKFNITMKMDTDGVEYPTGMQYKEAPTFWRKAPAS